MQHISIPVFLLVIVFAMSSWIDMYGIYVELPLFVNRLPEGWALPSHLGMAVEFANIGPLMFIIAVKVCPGRVKEWPFVLIIIGVGATACLSLVFLWDKTAFIFGQERSLGLLVICSILALVDCTSSVVYIPYMSQFKTQYLTAYFVGEGCGALIPGLVGLAQGVGSEPHCVNSTTFAMNATTGDNSTGWTAKAVYDPPVFSIEGYILFLFAIIILSGISFLILHLAPFCKKEHNENVKFVKNSNLQKEENELEHLKSETPDEQERNHTQSNSNTDADVSFTGDTRLFALQLLMTSTAVAIQYGILPAVAPYSAIPYGNVEYNLLVRLCSTAIPLSAFFTLFYSTTSVLVHLVLTCITAVLAGYHLFLASCSPHPPLQGTTAGSVIMVSTGILGTMLGQYTCVSIGAMIKISRGKQGLLWYGASAQIGTFLGTVLSFILINVLQVFTDIPPC